MIKMSLDLQVKEIIGDVTRREEKDGGYGRKVGWGMGNGNGRMEAMDSL
jgi:hypothetical protein